MDARTILGRVFATITPIFAAFGGVLVDIAPPSDRPGQSDYIAVGIASLGSAAIMLLVMALTQKWSQQKRRRFFIPAAVFSFVVGLVGVVLYVGWFRHHTVLYPPEAAHPVRSVMGNEHLPDPARYVDKYPEMQDNPVGLLRKFGGKPSSVWTATSIEAVRSWLLATYTVIAMLLASTLICLSEGVLVAKPRRTKK